MDKVQYSNYLVGGCASIGATLVTNPLEVIKTRLQLQGEQAKSGTYKKSYNSVLHSFVQVARHDGIRGLQKGLSAALGFQFTLNALRLGCFDTAKTLGWTSWDDGRGSSVMLSYFWGGFAGCVGSCAGSPFFLVKTQLQSYTPTDIAVGYQRSHDGMMHAFRKIYSARGIRGLYRGVMGNIPRAALGSGAQLATFEPTKEFLHRNGWAFESKAANSFLCGLIAGSTMSVMITPPDIILTRLYNQPLNDHGKGLYYSGIVDCMWKILKTEGVAGMYKGFWPNYLRVAPHSTLVLLSYDQMKAFRDA